MKLELIVTTLSMNADILILMRWFINRLINYGSFPKDQSWNVEKFKIMLIHQPVRARCRYNINWIVDPLIFHCLSLSESGGLVKIILIIFSFYNSLIRWARVVLEPTWYWERDLQSVRSCQAKPHFTGQLPGTIAINFVYVWLNRLLFFYKLF